jgi:hypothetical protein
MHIAWSEHAYANVFGRNDSAECPSIFKQGMRFCFMHVPKQEILCHTWSWIVGRCGWYILGTSKLGTGIGQSLLHPCWLMVVWAYNTWFDGVYILYYCNYFTIQYNVLNALWTSCDQLHLPCIFEFDEYQTRPTKSQIQYRPIIQLSNLFDAMQAGPVLYRSNACFCSIKLR